MTTPNDVHVNVSETGSVQTRARLMGVAGALRTVGTSTTRNFLPFLGLNLLTGLLGGSLLAMALSGGSAANSMIRLQSVLEGLLDPFVTLFAQFVEWFAQLPRWAQNLFLLGALFFALLGPLSSAVRFLLAIGRAIVAVLPLVARLAAAMLRFAAAVLVPIAPLIAIVGLLYLLYTRSEAFRNVFTDLFSGLVRSAQDFLNLLVEANNITARIVNAAVSRGLLPRSASLEILPRYDFSGVTNALNRVPSTVTNAGFGPFGAFTEAEAGLFAQLPTLEDLRRLAGIGQEPEVTDLVPTYQQVLGPPPPDITNNYFYGLDANAVRQEAATLFTAPQQRTRDNGGF